MAARSKKKSPLGNRHRRVLMMGDDGIVLYAVEKKKAIRIISLSWDTEKFDERLVAALKGGYSGDVVLLYNAVEQHYRKERIPKVGFADKAKVLNRKLNLAFPNLSTRAALELKTPRKIGRGDAGDARPEYLFAALPKSENMTRVVSILYEAEVGIMGLGLLPVESVGLVEELADRCVESQNGIRSKWSILIGQHETGGLRQVVVKDGNLAMARLTPVAHNVSETGLSGEIVREFKATLSYISRFGYSPNDGLDVVIIAPKESHAGLMVSKLAVANLCLLDLPDALQTLGGRYAGEATQTYADALHVLWVAKKPRLAMPMKMPDLEKVSNSRKTAQAISFAGLLGIMVFMWLIYNSYSTYHEKSNLVEFKTTQKAALTREYEQESKVFSELPVIPAVVNGALEVDQMLRDNSIELTPIFKLLHKELEENFFIQKMSIEHEPTEETSLAGIDADEKKSSVGRAIKKLTDSFSKGDGVHGVMTVNFTIGTLQPDLPLEEKVLLAERLLSNLRATLPTYAIDLVKQFGGVTRTGSFSVGGMDEGQNQGESQKFAEFSIKGAPL